MVTQGQDQPTLRIEMTTVAEATTKMTKTTIELEDPFGSTDLNNRGCSSVERANWNCEGRARTR